VPGAATNIQFMVKDPKKLRAATGGGLGGTASFEQTANLSPRPSMSSCSHATRRRRGWRVLAVRAVGERLNTQAWWPYERCQWSGEPA